MTKAEQIAQEIAQIKGRSQVLLAEEVVEWARAHKASALHGCFTWNDGEAAEQYRLMQARRVLQLYVVPGTSERRFISLSVDRKKEGGGYRAVEAVMSTPSLREIALRDALAELRRVQRRYAELRELAEVYAAIDRAASTLKLGAPGESRAA
jgi:hypothetical protein